MSRLWIVIVSLLWGFALTAQERPTEEWTKIATHGSAAEKKQLAEKLIVLTKKSKNVKDYEVAVEFLGRLGEQEREDSLRRVTIKKFPKSKVARANYISEVYYKLKGAAAKEKSYQHLLKNWPIEQEENLRIAYDYVTSDLANSFAEEGDKNKALHYLQNLQERFWRGQGYISVATKLLEQGDTATALPLIQTAISDAEYYITLPKEEKDNRAGFAAVGYPGYISQLVNVYNAQGKYSEALALIERAMELAPEQTGRFSASYYQGLEKSGRKLEALHQLEILYRQGNFSREEKMKELYIALNGSARGYDLYLQRMQSDVIQSIRQHIAGNAVYKDAPDFELLNLDGDKVSLSSLKGKVVVLDFWATWCQPCIRSFPGMRAAQKHYEDDEGVKFLFVNTWERDKNYKEKVAAFIADNSYPFEVLFDDQKDPESGKNLAAELGVRGIPAKFIIDAAGKIRYELTGSGSDADYIKLEMIELIESAKRPKE